MFSPASAGPTGAGLPRRPRAHSSDFVALHDGPPPNSTWKRDLPVWAVLALDRQVPGWRARYHHVGTGMRWRGVLGVVLTPRDGQSAVFVRKG